MPLPRRRSSRVAVLALMACFALCLLPVCTGQSWVTGDWSECVDCDSVSASQSRTVQCEQDGAVVSDPSVCPSPKPVSSQSCSCSKTTLSTLMLIVGLIVGILGGTILFVVCCYLRKFIRYQIKAYQQKAAEPKLTDLEAQKQEEEEHEIDLEMAARRAKRKRKKKKSHKKKHRHHRTQHKYEADSEDEYDEGDGQVEEDEQDRPHSNEETGESADFAPHAASASPPPPPPPAEVKEREDDDGDEGRLVRGKPLLSPPTLQVDPGEPSDEEASIGPRSPQPRHQPISLPLKLHMPKRLESLRTSAALPTPSSPGGPPNQVRVIRDGHLLFSPVTATSSRRLAKPPSQSVDPTHYVISPNSLASPRADESMFDPPPSAPNGGEESPSLLTVPRATFSFDMPEQVRRKSSIMTPDSR